MDEPGQAGQGRREEEADTGRQEESVQQTETSPDDGKKKYPDYCRTLVVRDHHGVVKELVFPKALDLDRPKRARTTFSAEQLYSLEREFQRNQYLVGRERTQLAQSLGLSETQVKVWFQNRRTKYKRDKGREDEEKSSQSETVATCNLLRLLGPAGPTGPTGPAGPVPRPDPAAAPVSAPLAPPVSLPPALTPSLSLGMPGGHASALYSNFTHYQQHHIQMSQLGGLGNA